jgi:hypothetical protein
MGRGPGRVQIAILQTLAEWPDLDYGELCLLIFGEGFTVSDRTSTARAIRSLERQGKVETYFWGASVQCVRLASGIHRAPQFPERRALAKAAEHPLLPRGTPVVYPTSPALARARS